jgi:hypothetical protein
MREYARLDDAVNRYLAVYRSVLNEPLPADDESDWYPHTRPIQLDDQAALRLRFTSIPEIAPARDQLVAELTLNNWSSVPIATAAPWPSLLTYRWLCTWSGAVVVARGVETILQPPTWPQTESTYPMRLVAPSVPGEYVLQATIIQEGWRWLDALPPRVRADASVWVVARGDESRLPFGIRPAAALSPQRVR